MRRQADTIVLGEMFVSVNALREHLRTRQFVVTAALGPPKCAGADEVRERARLLVGHVDAAIVADNPDGAIAMAPIAVGVIAQQMGLEVVVEVAGRDRNRAALQSDLLGASALGLNAVLIAIGRQWQDGSEGTAPVVDDLRGLSLVRAATSLRNGTFLDGRHMEHPPSLFVGGSLLPTETDLALEAVKAGVDFVVAGPVVEIGPLSRMIEAVLQRAPTVAVCAVVPVVRSAEHAARLVRTLGPGISERVRSTFARAAADESAALAMAVELVAAIRALPGAGGVHLSAPEWPEAIPHIVRGIRATPPVLS